MKKEFLKPYLTVYNIKENYVWTGAMSIGRDDMPGNESRRWGGWNTGRQTDADTSDED